MIGKPTYEELEKRVLELEKANSKGRNVEAALEKRILALTQPISDTGSLSFEDLFNLDDIQRLQDEFALATGVASIITDTDGSPITQPSNFCRLCSDIIRKTEKGLINCYKSDAVLGRLTSKGPTIQTCMSGGLWDAGAGVSIGGQHIANWLIGQVRDVTQTEDKLRLYAREIGANEYETIAAFREVPSMSRERFEQVAQVLFTLANQLSTTAYQNVQQARFITERKLSEEALRESEERYRVIAENAADVIWTMDMNLNLTYISPSIYQQRGYTVEEAMEHSLDQTILSDSLEKMMNLFAEKVSLIESGDEEGFKPVDFEVPQPCKDGSVIWTSNNARILPSQNKQAASIIGITRDITTRKQAEEALKENRERVELALKGADLGMWDYDIPSSKWTLDERSIELLGAYPKNDAEMDALIHPDDLKHYTDTWDAVVAGRESSYIFQYRAKNTSGKYKWLMDKGKIVERDSNGAPTRAAGTLQDITKRKQVEKALRENEERLRQAQKMESIGTLAGGIAHDFNNILFPIVGNTEMLLEDIPEDSPLRGNLNEVFKGAMRAKELVKQILTFARQDSNEIKLMKIQPVIKEAVKLIRSTIPTSIEIKQYISNDCGAIKVDPTQIHQVVMNLATNAYHAMEDTGGELKVNLKEIELGEQDLPNPDMEPGPYACLTVADSGTGINQDMREKIFDPFFTTKELGKGTGMGLSVIHGIVQSIGGSIHVNSEPGKGSEFHVCLPVVKSSYEQQEPQTKEPIHRGTEQILLVDDEEAIVFVEKQMLKRLGYTAVSHTSSVDALEAFRTDPDKFDLVISDMSMPNMTGDILVSELLEIRPDIPILLCTGFSEKVPEEKAKSLGIKGLLMKPIVMKDLSKMIREVLENKESSS